MQQIVTIKEIIIIIINTTVQMKFISTYVM